MGHVWTQNENRYSAPQPIVLSSLAPLAPSSSSQKRNPRCSDENSQRSRKAVEEQKSRRAILFFPCVCKSTSPANLFAVVVISVVIGYGIYWQARPSTEKTLEQIETL